MKSGDRIVPPSQAGELLNILRDAKNAVSRMPCMLNRFNECDEKAIQSHTISASVLRLIAESGQLFKMDLDPREFDAEKSFKPRKIGVRAAGSFKGFCQNHDQSLFQSVDTKEMAVTAENLELLFFRALAQEITKKAANVLALRTFYYTDDFVKSDGTMEKASVRVALGLRDNFFDFDTIANARRQKAGKIQFCCFDIKCTPIIAGVGILNPEAFFNYFPKNSEYDGRIYRNVLFCLLPTATGQRIVFAWFKGANHTVKPLLDRFTVARKNLFEFAVQFCLEHCECSYFRPSAWEQFDDPSIALLISLADKNIDGMPYDIYRRPLKEVNFEFEYTFARQHTNSTWAKQHYGRDAVS